jgi:hypothetical protein
MLEIWSVDGGNNDTEKTGTAPIRKFTCSVDDNHVLQIGVAGFDKTKVGNSKVLYCILIGLDNAIRVFTPQGPVNIPATPIWNIDFEGVDNGTYLIACHSSDDGNDYAEVAIVPPVSSSVSSSKKNLLAFDPAFPIFGGNKITAQGTVLEAGNTVKCTINPMNCDSGVIGHQATEQDAGWLDQQQTHWRVEFDNKIGCYQLHCANSEGDLYAHGDAG